MVALVTGGASNVGAQVAQNLRQGGRPVKFGARSGKRIPEGFEYVLVDWDQPSTFPNPFPVNHGITSVYIVSPLTNLTSSSNIIPFIQVALDAGVRMFVNLSGSVADADHDSGGLGTIPKFLAETLSQGLYEGLDYVILRPTWFTDNFISEWQDDICRRDRVTTCVPSGKMPFVASSDIAWVGFEAMIYGSHHFKRRDPFIIGPELLSYDDVVSILTKVLGRRIEHNIVTEDEMREYYRKLYESTSGSPEDFEALLDWSIELDRGLERGSEERLSKEKGVVLGKVDVQSWVQERKNLFECSPNSV